MKNTRDIFHDSVYNTVVKKGLMVLQFAMLIILISTTNLFAGSSLKGDEQQEGKKKITGTVTDESGLTLPGVTVTVKGTPLGVSTDADGRYELEVPESTTLLLFSYIGMKPQVVTIGTQTIINVVLEEDLFGLGEVVIIGYGTAKKADLSAAIVDVPDVDKLKERPTLSTAGMLQGVVPGVTVVANGGHPDREPSITIRGVGSGSESVLYVVDGVPGGLFNPEDVESIVVLKDAASAAIYGAQAGNAGVILVTTRKAKAGAPSVEYSGFYGLKQAYNLPQSLTAEKEADVANLARDNAGIDRLDGWDKSINPYVYTTRTDWVDEIFRLANIMRHTVTINAGTDKMSNMFQARYESDGGTLLNTYNENMSLRFNSNYELNKYITFKEDLFWNNNSSRGTDTESGYTGTILSAIYMPRSATVYYEDGTFGGVGPRDSDYLGIHGDVVNPVASLLRNKAYNKGSKLMSSSELKVSNIIKGLAFTSRFSYMASNSFYKYFKYSRTEPGKPDVDNYLTYSTNKGYSWDWENTLNYERVFSGHNIGLMVSTTSSEDGNRYFGTTAYGFANESLWAQFLANADTERTDETEFSDGQYEDRNTSYVSRASYSFADRYFITGSYRVDIAGRLPVGGRTMGFPAATAAWKVSSEPWFNISQVDLLKIRASWGKIGNLSSIWVNYGYAALEDNYLYQIGDGAPYSAAYYVGNAFNADLTWETSITADFGFDISLLGNRLNLSIDYFNKKTVDLIQTQEIEWTDSYGVSAPYINQGEISNSGFEFMGSWNDKAGELKYGISANFATLKNEVAYIDNNPDAMWVHDDIHYRYSLYPYASVVGQPFHSYWLYETDGIFQSDGEAQAYTADADGDGVSTMIQPNAKAGDIKFKDNDNDGSIDDDDRRFKGSGAPKFTYAFSGNLEWKNWGMNIMFQGVAGVKLFNAFKESTLNAAEQGYNRSEEILNAWSETNTGSEIPIIRATDYNKNFQTTSDFYLEKGDYLRLKSLLISYSFTKLPWNGKIKVYLSGDNLLTFTDYSGIDPEVGGWGFDQGQYPVARIYAIGANINF